MSIILLLFFYFIKGHNTILLLDTRVMIVTRLKLCFIICEIIFSKHDFTIITEIGLWKHKQNMILARVCTIMYNSLCATIISTIACKVANHHKKETSFLIYIHIRIPLPPKVYFACSERKSKRGKVIVKNSSQSKA